MNTPDPRSRTLAAARDRLSAALAADDDRVAVLTRYDRWADDLWDGLEPVYDPEAVLPALVDVIAAVHLARRPALRQRDRERILRPFDARKARYQRGRRKGFQRIASRNSIYVHLCFLAR